MKIFDLNKFATCPSSKMIKILIVFSLILLFIVYPIMTWQFVLSGDIVSPLESQLSFSGAFLKVQYATIIGAGGLENYRIGQILDYGFMVSYSSLIFSLGLIIARKFTEPSIWRKLGFVLAIAGPITACFDATENAFILLTLTDPLGFPDWWALAHSSAALVKWILLLIAIIGELLAVSYYLLVIRRKK